MSKRDRLSSAGEFKRGRLGNDEMAYIKANAYAKPLEEIVAALNRSPDVVTKYIKDHVPPPKAVTKAQVEDAERVTIRQELRTSEAWKALKDEFFPEELKFFEEVYLKMMAQMSRDQVLSTEETQVFQAVKYEVLMSRNLRQRKVALLDIGRLEDMQRAFLDQFGGDPRRMNDAQRDTTIQMESQLNIARSAEKNLTGEYAKLQERHADLLKNLKTTRDQRVKLIEGENKLGFLSVIKELQRRDQQELQGRQMELVKLAGRAEYKRLGTPVVYENGDTDNPILSADTVDFGPVGVEVPDGDVESSSDED